MTSTSVHKIFIGNRPVRLQIKPLGEVVTAAESAAMEQAFNDAGMFATVEVLSGLESRMETGDIGAVRLDIDGARSVLHWKAAELLANAILSLPKQGE